MENKLNVPKLEYKTGEPMWIIDTYCVEDIY